MLDSSFEIQWSYKKASSMFCKFIFKYRLNHVHLSPEQYFTNYFPKKTLVSFIMLIGIMKKNPQVSVHQVIMRNLYILSNHLETHNLPSKITLWEVLWKKSIKLSLACIDLSQEERRERESISLSKNGAQTAILANKNLETAFQWHNECVMEWCRALQG